MKYRKLGKTELQVSTIAMGCWAIVGDETWGKQDEQDAIAAFHTALDLGINFFDSAEGYGAGRSEELLARGIAGHRREVIIATKVGGGHLAPDDVIAACERSLRRLKTDYIDLYQIHWPNRKVPLEETVTALETLQKQGKIRAIGVSNFGKGDLTNLLAAGNCSANQLPYSLLWRAIEYDITDICVAHEISILPYSPLAQGLLTGKFASPEDVPEGRARTRLYSSERPLVRHGEPGYEKETFTVLDNLRKICDAVGKPMAQIALAWLLEQPGVTSVLAGARSPEQVKQNAQAAELFLSDDIIQELNEITADVKTHFGANPDMWQADENTRYQ